MDGMDTLSFRPANHADIPALVALVTSAYRGDVSRQGWTTEADLLDGQRIDPDVLARDIGRARSRILVAERGGEMLACAQHCICLHVDHVGADQVVSRARDDICARR